MLTKDDLKTGTLKDEPGKYALVEIEYQSKRCRVVYNGSELCNETLETEPGRLELFAEAKSLLRVDEFKVEGLRTADTEALLALDALAGAASTGNEWKTVSDIRYKFATGCVSATEHARAKWVYTGRGFRLWAPKGPEYGTCEVLADGKLLGEVNLNADKVTPSAVVLEHKLSDGYHAVVIRSVKGKTALDVLEIDPPETK